MRRVLVALAVVLSVAACGSGATDSSKTTNASKGTTTSAAPAPAQRILSEQELTNALLAVQELPPGYSQDPPTPNPNKTFCDYKPPFEEKTYVDRSFTKGGGLSSEVLSVGLRQYADADQAKAAFKALTDALATCTGETWNGSKLTYAPMSAPKVGDGAVGVKMNSDGTDLLQFFALDGPVLVNTGGGGLMNANADEVISLLKAQVTKYHGSAESSR